MHIQADSNGQLTLKRAIRTKVQPPSRASERLKEQCNQKTKTVESDPVNDTYLHIGGDPESEEKDEEFESSKSNLESETEENNKNIEDRVENDLKRKQEVKPTDTKQKSSAFKYSSTPVSRNQNLYTNPSQPIKVESTYFPTQLVNDQPGPSKLYRPNPLIQADTQPTPLQNVTAIHNPLTDAKPSIPYPPAMTQPKSYEVLYKCLRETGISREDAATGAKAVLASSKVMPGTSVPQATNVGGNQVDCSTKSSPSYYNSQKLLQNQQQQTLSLLAQVPAFNGMGSTKFEDWIQNFERVVDTSELEEGRKIKLLASKLFGSAGYCITTFQLNYPREAKSFSKVKQNLHEHNRGMYFTEFKNCIRNSGESIRDYACRLQKLYSFAYPKEEGRPTDMRLRETMLMDGFLGGLKANLRERMRFKEFKTLDDLLKATERCAAILNEVKLEKKTSRGDRGYVGHGAIMYRAIKICKSC